MPVFVVVIFPELSVIDPDCIDPDCIDPDIPDPVSSARRVPEFVHSVEPE